ncbi:hypothetical protein Tco_0227127, partial [Tanacetum coccineum]
SFEDKILTPIPDSSPRCARCGTPVDGSSCRGCAFLRKKFDEDLLAYCVENGIFQDFQNTFESSDDNTNVVNALREPFVVNQDPGVKSSQDPLQIDHNCCYEYGDSLDGFFCRQCICKSCGKGAHYGYNCPPKDLIISKPEPCNQTINEIPQTLPSLDPSCYSLPYVSKHNFVDNSPIFSYPPPQPQFETYLCELCGNNAHYGYDCSPQFPFDIGNDSKRGVYVNQSMKLTMNLIRVMILPEFDQPQPPQDSVDHQGILQVLNKMEEKLEEIIRDRRKKIEDMSIEEMRHEEQLVDYKIKEIINNLGYKRFRGEEIDEEYERDYIMHLYSTSKSITTDLPIQEPNNSLNMGNEHLDTIPATESDEVIKSSVENLVPIPSEFEIDPILEEFADELAHIAPIPPGIVEADPDDDTSSDDDDFEDVEYVSFEEVNDVEQEEKEFDLEDILQIQDVILRERLLKIKRHLNTNIES